MTTPNKPEQELSTYDRMKLAFDYREMAEAEAEAKRNLREQQLEARVEELLEGLEKAREAAAKFESILPAEDWNRYSDALIRIYHEIDKALEAKK